MSQSDRFQITSVTLERIHYIQCPAVNSESDLQSLKKHLEDWSALDAKLHVLDLRNMYQASPDFIKAIANFAEVLKKRDSGLISIHMNDGIFAEVRKMGLEGLLNRVLNYPGDLYQKREVSKDEMCRLLIQYMVESAQQALKVTMHSTLSYSEKDHLPASAAPWEAVDFISVIEVDDETMESEFRLYATNEVLGKMATAMLGRGTKIDEPVIEGAALELLNMVYGQAKANLNDKESLGLPKAIPRLVRKRYMPGIRRSPDVIILTLKTPMGNIYLDVDILKFKG